MFAYFTVLFSTISLFVVCLPIISGGRTSWAEASPAIIAVSLLSLIFWWILIANRKTIFADQRRLLRCKFLLNLGILAVVGLVALAAHAECVQLHWFDPEKYRDEIKSWALMRGMTLLVMLPLVLTAINAFLQLRQVPNEAMPGALSTP